ncbi:MAG: CopG family ribbon-helix-helix protein [Halanaeroarchaeum sp.]
MRDGVERMSVTIPPTLRARLDEVVEAAGYESRSEATRDALRAFVLEVERESGLSGRLSGTVVVLYDHDYGGVSDAMTDLQHDYAETVVAVQHVHLGERLCLESIAVDGAGERIAALVSRLRPLEGVHNVELTVVGADP